MRLKKQSLVMKYSTANCEVLLFSLVFFQSDGNLKSHHETRYVSQGNYFGHRALDGLHNLNVAFEQL